MAQVLKDGGLVSPDRSARQKKSAFTTRPAAPKQALQEEVILKEALSNVPEFMYQVHEAKSQYIDEQIEAQEQEVHDVALVQSAVDLARVISIVYDNAKDMRSSMDDLLHDLEALWERAENIATMEDAMITAMATFRHVKNKIGLYEQKLNQAEDANRQRAMVIHSEARSLNMS